MALRLGTYVCEKGKYQYRVIGPRPGTKTREHRVPGGRFASKEEALDHANAFLSRTNPWEGHQYREQQAKRKRAEIAPKRWHVDEILRDQISYFHCFVAQNVAAEDEVCTAAGMLLSL